MYFALIASFRYVRLSFNVRVKFKHFVSKNKVFINNTVVAESLLYFLINYSLPLVMNRYFVLLNYSCKSRSIIKIRNNLHILRMQKLCLEVKFDQDLSELSKV